MPVKDNFLKPNKHLMFPGEIILTLPKLVVVCAVCWVGGREKDLYQRVAICSEGVSGVFQR